METGTLPENPKATRPNHHRLCLGASVPAGRVASREVEHTDRDTALSLPVSQWSFGCWAYRRPQDPAGWLEGTLGTWLILFSRARLSVCHVSWHERSRAEHGTQHNGWPLELIRARAGDHNLRAWADHICCNRQHVGCHQWHNTLCNKMCGCWLNTQKSPKEVAADASAMPSRET